MAGQTPFFMSGPRLLIKIDGVKVAYAVGLDLRVSRNVQIVNTLGSFASVALQATMYNGVSGSMQIVRLMDKTSRTTLDAAGQATKDPTSSPAVSSLPEKSLTGISGTVPDQAGTANSVITATENLKKHLDPASVLASSTFDIEVWQMYPTMDNVEAGKEPSLNNNGVLVKHFTVQNCRLNSRSASISAGQLLTESFSFTGTLLVSEDRAESERDAADTSAFGTDKTV